MTEGDSPAMKGEWDAAQTFDPLSSQGITMALTSGYGAGSAAARALAGDAAALGRYAHEQEAAWDDYARRHRHYYDCQPRWPDRPFWKRRRASRLAPSASDPSAKETPCDVSPLPSS